MVVVTNMTVITDGNTHTVITTNTSGIGITSTGDTSTLDACDTIIKTKQNSKLFETYGDLHLFVL